MFGKVLVVIFTATIIVYADFDVNLYDLDTKRYLSVIEEVDTHYIKAAKGEPDMFCKFNFVTSELGDGKVSFQTSVGVMVLQ